MNDAHNNVVLSEYENNTFFFLQNILCCTEPLFVKYANWCAICVRKTWIKRLSLEVHLCYFIFKFIIILLFVHKVNKAKYFN